MVSFCGIVVPYKYLPYFWQSWMYPLTPFRYLLEAMLALVTHGVPVHCENSELAKFSSPPGQTCDSYAGQYAQQLGGYVTTLDNGLCGFCQYRDGDAFAASFNVYYSVSSETDGKEDRADQQQHIWRDYGIFWGYCAFNLLVVFLASWIYLSGGRKLMRRLRNRKK